MTMQDALSQILQILKSEYGYQQVALDIDVGPERSFVVLSSSKDPQHIVVISDIVSSRHRSPVTAVKEIESFVWEIFSQRKHNILSALLVTAGNGGDADEQQNNVIRRLSRLCRVVTVSAELTPDSIRQELRLFGPPVLAPNPAGLVLGRLRSELGELSQGLDQSVVDKLVGAASTAKSPAELGKRISEVFEQMISEVSGALTKPTAP